MTFVGNANEQGNKLWRLMVWTSVRKNKVEYFALILN
jgi:hypothetical protein